MVVVTTVSTIIEAYPNSFVVAVPVKRNEARVVELAGVMGVCPTKEEAIVQQAICSMVGVRTFLIPTFEETDGALKIEITGDKYKSEPLISPSEYAKMFRDYYGL